jgi:hypothetical protein
MSQSNGLPSCAPSCNHLEIKHFTESKSLIFLREQGGFMQRNEKPDEVDLGLQLGSGGKDLSAASDGTSMRIVYLSCS